MSLIKRQPPEIFSKSVFFNTIHLFHHNPFLTFYIKVPLKYIIVHDKVDPIQ
jgi:hypothetical protein